MEQFKTNSMETIFINKKQVSSSLQRHTSYIWEKDITQCTDLCRDVCTIIVGYIDEYKLESVHYKANNHSFSSKWRKRLGMKANDHIFPTKLITSGEKLLFNYDQHDEMTVCYTNFKTSLAGKVHVRSGLYHKLAFDITLITGSTTQSVRISEEINQGKIIYVATVVLARRNFCDAILDTEFNIVKFLKTNIAQRDLIIKKLDLFKRILQLCQYVDINFTGIYIY